MDDELKNPYLVWYDMIHKSEVESMIDWIELNDVGQLVGLGGSCKAGDLQRKRSGVRMDGIRRYVALGDSSGAFCLYTAWWRTNFNLEYMGGGE